MFRIIGILLLSVQCLMAQDIQIHFAKGLEKFDENILEFNKQKINTDEIHNGKFYRFIHIKHIPKADQVNQMALKGIELLEYIPNNIYLAALPLQINQAELISFGIDMILPVSSKNKCSERIEAQEFPFWAMEGSKVNLMVQFQKNIDIFQSIGLLNEKGIGILNRMDHAHIAVVQAEQGQIQSLIDAPYIRFVDYVSEPGEPESDDGRHLHRANAIDGDYYGAMNFDATGITFAINDDGFVGPHIDFKGRTNQSDVAGDLAGSHGDMCTGIAGGAGNLDPEIRGMATGAYIHVRQYVSSMPGTQQLHQDSAILIFSSSYSNGCNAGYTTTTQLVDQEVYNNPTLMQTFSAGNSNNQDCGYGAGSQWGNITGGHKIGKNVIATANLSEVDGVINSSSRGPASDGRIKPDIAAHGNSQMSTDPDNGYAPGGGTSAAAPGICGVMAQLHHAYQTFNAGATAPSALLKATLLNTANDLGNEGPDFTYGWGKVNAYKAVKLLEENRYLSSTITQGDSNFHSINIPPGVQRARIMVYWADKEASTSSSIALVNDLDASITQGSTTYLPWLLDHTPNAANLSQPAGFGADHLNNVEQIVIDNPSFSVYDLKIIGNTIPFGPQEYFVVYEFLTEDITVIHPMGGEGLTPGNTTRIHWDAYGSSGVFNVEYSLDNGSSWNTINAAAAGSTRFLNWTVPNNISGQALVRVSRGAASDQSDANFSIMERPQNIRVNRVCPNLNAIQLAWDAVPGATGYDIFMLGATHMDSVGSTTGLLFNVPVADINDEQWFSVRATGANGLRSMRQVAINYAGASAATGCFLACTGDNDAGVAAINSPGNILETCGGLSTTNITVTFENKGLFTESNFPVYYQFGTNPVVSETFTGSIISGGTASFTFATPLTIPVANVYDLMVWTGLSSDSTICNDTILMTVEVLEPVSSFPYTEDFESGVFPPDQSYIANNDNDQTWEPAQVTGSNGLPTNCMYINNFNYNAPGEEDVFSFVSLDMTQAGTGATAYLTFDVAYARYNGSYFDELRIDISTDCGSTFNQIYFKSGTTLATVGDQTNNWSPGNANEWRKDSIDLNAYLGQEVVFRFVNINGYGQNLYIDNINVNVLGALPPSANFSADVIYSCDGVVNFQDQSGNQPTQWLWSFGDGGISTQQNPSYTYAFSGTYTVSLQVTNPLGTDTETKTSYVVVEYPNTVSINNGGACPNESVNLSATSSNGTLYWYDGANNLVNIGNNFSTPPLAATTNYQVQNVVLTPELGVGPIDGSLGGGGYHGGTFYGAINFNAFNDFELISVWVDADGAGPRTITLWDGNIANGGATPTNTVLQQTTVNLVDGPQRVYLNFQIPGPGLYSIGGNQMDLYRNNSGPTYPYTLPGIVSLVSSTANSSSSFYYYLYDWKVRLDSCAGPSNTITAEIAEANFSAATTGSTVTFTDNSVGATSWLWDFGDGNSSSQQNPTHTYTANGPFLVTLTINNGVCTYVDTIQLAVNVHLIDNNSAIKLYPNPSKGDVTIELSENLSEALQIEIYSADGKSFMQHIIAKGTKQETLTLDRIVPGVYIVKLSNSSFVESRKLIIRD